MHEQVVEIIKSAVRDAGEALSDATKANLSTETPLYGKQGILDSIGLVSMIADVEQEVEDAFDRSITLADEKAMSQARSPFRTIGSLADYVCQILEPATS